MQFSGRTDGFTLIELMVTLAVAAILAAMAAPSFRTLLANNRLSTQTNELVGAVTFTRSEAVKRGRNVTLCRADSDTALTCLAGNQSEWEHWIVVDPAIDAADSSRVLRRGSIATQQISVEASSNITDAANEIVFRADGLARGTDGSTLLVGTLRICSDTQGLDQNARLLELRGGGRATTSTASETCNSDVSNPG
ncbi:prepilin-type N-terminal cleavage/methylation domain-containing protein [Azoarcus indigens]|uniref:Type II secretion system protein H n=1 Tax=Azoarcus indigens TaxID=29545 RepID=A0A4V3BP38_9RHOO|nr:GspH/FimT family pseudopilin [Azoarcus indigens]NMG63689.1 prepilin-type N-terminal cleavage/methylation domain-containing protein [Azoarcus indigens]TDN56222.1 type IV fimbrial biogenesis protein FimT [Azoarcus indigens]